MEKELALMHPTEEIVNIHEKSRGFPLLKNIVLYCDSVTETVKDCRSEMKNLNYLDQTKWEIAQERCGYNNSPSKVIR